MKRNLGQVLRDYFLRDLWQKNIAHAGRIHRAGVQSLRVFFVLLREFASGQLDLRAMSLVYTTLLSLVPLLAVSFSMLKAFGVHNQLEPALANVLSALGPQGAELTERIIGFVSNIKVGVLGTVGLLFLLWTVITLIQKIEEAFNYVWRVRRVRPLTRRFADYLSVITIGPLLVFSSVGLSSSLLSGRLFRRLAETDPFGVVAFAAGKLLPYLFTIAAFTFLYMFITNTRVRLRSALVGAAVAGAMWMAIGKLFQSVVAASAQYAAIYSGFASVMVFIMWLYMTWMILLIGSEVAYFHQHPYQVRLGRGDFRLSSRLKEQAALTVMYLVVDRYMHGAPPWTTDSLVERLTIPGEAVDEVVTVLLRKGFLAEITVAEQESAYLPAQDPASVTINEILGAIRSAEEDGYRVESFRLDVPAVAGLLSKLADDVDQTLAGRTLRELVEHGEDTTPALLEETGAT